MERLPYYQGKLDEAKEAMEKMGPDWSCNPPDQEIDLVKLEIGRPNKKEKEFKKTFITNYQSLVKIEAMVLLLKSVECNHAKLIWTTKIPKYGLSHKIKSKLVQDDSTDDQKTSISGNEGLTIYDARFISSGNKAKLTISSPTDNMTNQYSNYQSSYEHAQQIPIAPDGDRGDDFEIHVNIKLYCNGQLSDNLTYVIEQDEIDQLRQEYVDMKKVDTPSRKEFIGDIYSDHFSFDEFNASQKVSGNEYDRILCKIIDNLAKVRKKAGNVEMIINSGFRNPYKNALIKGAKESRHIYGRAADIRLIDFNADNRTDEKDWWHMAKAAKENGACVEPINLAPTWIHMDWRSKCPPGW